MLRNLLTRVEGRGLQFLLPLLVDLDEVLVVLWLLPRHSYLLGMLQDGIKVAVVTSVDDVEEILSVRQVGGGLLLGEKLSEFGLSHDVLDEMDHAQLVVPWDIDGPDLIAWDKVLSPVKDLFQKVFRDFLQRSHVELP